MTTAEREPVQTVTAYVGLGSNLQDPRAQICRALGSLRAIALPTSLRRSGLYQSEPLGPPGQPDYLNAVVSFQTRISPPLLLQSLQAIEQEHGRERTVRWGPRSLDLDILLYGRSIVAEAGLQIPHPRIPDRVFVLRPLRDLDPDLDVPGMGPVKALLDHCPAQRLESLEWDG